MITPKVKNCKNCAEILPLIEEIDCKIFEASLSAYNNIVFALNLYIDYPDILALLHYKNILIHKQVNPDYIKEVCIADIASKVKLRTLGCVPKCHCKDFGVVVKPTTTTTTTVAPITTTTTTTSACLSWIYTIDSFRCSDCTFISSGGLNNAQPLTVGKWYYFNGNKIHITSLVVCSVSSPVDNVLNSSAADTCAAIVCPTTTTTTTSPGTTTTTTSGAGTTTTTTSGGPTTTTSSTSVGPTTTTSSTTAGPTTTTSTTPVPTTTTTTTPAPTTTTTTTTIGFSTQMTINIPGIGNNIAEGDTVLSGYTLGSLITINNLDPTKQIVFSNISQGYMYAEIASDGAAYFGNYSGIPTPSVNITSAPQGDTVVPPSGSVANLSFTRVTEGTVYLVIEYYVDGIGNTNFKHWMLAI